MEVVGAYNACAPPACSHSRSQNRALSEKPRLLQGTHTHIYTHVNTNTNAQREGGVRRKSKGSRGSEGKSGRGANEERLFDY